MHRDLTLREGRQLEGVSLTRDEVLLLAEKREGAPRPLSASFEEDASEEVLGLPLEPAFLLGSGLVLAGVARVGRG
mgnify:CR=1 FL=1